MLVSWLPESSLLPHEHDCANETTLVSPVRLLQSKLPFELLPRSSHHRHPLHEFNVSELLVAAVELLESLFDQLSSTFFQSFKLFSSDVLNRSNSSGHG